MKKLILIAFLVSLFGSMCFASEQIDLTVPITTPSITYYRVVKLQFDWQEARVSVYLKSSADNEQLAFYYTGAEATALMVAMNKMNFSTTSMHKKVLQKLVADGHLTGSITGNPD